MANQTHSPPEKIHWIPWTRKKGSLDLGPLWWYAKTWGRSQRKPKIRIYSTSHHVCVAFVFLHRFLDQESINTPQRIVQHIHSHPVTSTWQFHQAHQDTGSNWKNPWAELIFFVFNMSGVAERWETDCCSACGAQIPDSSMATFQGIEEMSCKSLVSETKFTSGTTS